MKCIAILTTCIAIVAAHKQTASKSAQYHQQPQYHHPPPRGYHAEAHHYEPPRQQHHYPPERKPAYHPPVHYPPHHEEHHSLGGGYEESASEYDPYPEPATQEPDPYEEPEYKENDDYPETVTTAAYSRDMGNVIHIASGNPSTDKRWVMWATFMFFMAVCCGISYLPVKTRFLVVKDGKYVEDEVCLDGTRDAAYGEEDYDDEEDKE